MLEVGNKVKIIKTGAFGTVKWVRSNFFDYPIVVEFGIGCDYYKENDLELVIEGMEKEEIKETINPIKSNRIRRTTKVKNSIIEWNIEGKYIEIEVSGDDFHIVSLLKLILKETELYNYQYSRVSPYKIYKAPYDKNINSHDFILEFIDVKDDYKLKIKKIISTSKTMTIHGRINLFIPDLLEVCVDRGILKRNNNGYTLNRSLNSNGCVYEYIQSKPNANILKSQGFIIPNNY